MRCGVYHLSSLIVVVRDGRFGRKRFHFNYMIARVLARLLTRSLAHSRSRVLAHSPGIVVGATALRVRQLGDAARLRIFHVHSHALVVHTLRQQPPEKTIVA